MSEPRLWHPIETAPKDCTEVELSEGGYVSRGYWETRQNYWGETGWHQSTDSQYDWYSTNPWHPQKWRQIVDEETV
jgi:hypothetical protein